MGSRPWQRSPHVGRRATKAVASYVDMTAGGRDLCRHLRRRALAEEVAQGGGDQVRGFLREEVAGGQGSAADVDSVFLPDAERLVAAADEALGAPQHQDRAFELVPGGEGLVVVDHVDARGRTVVGAGARDGPGVAEAADVVLHHGGVEAGALAEEGADDGADPVS